MAPLGRAALLVAFGCLLYAALAGGYAAARRRRRLALSARNALLAAFGATAVAVAVLVAALLRHDFTFAYVAEHTSRALPARYRLSALWGGQEGSLLFWLLVLTGYSSLAVLAARRAGRDLLELDIDLRLSDLWREAGEITDWNIDVVAAFMRAAYGKGYCDALTEDAPGSLCHDHGYRIPGRRPAPTREA